MGQDIYLFFGGGLGIETRSSGRLSMRSTTELQPSPEVRVLPVMSPPGDDKEDSWEQMGNSTNGELENEESFPLPTLSAWDGPHASLLSCKDQDRLLCREPQLGAPSRSVLGPGSQPSWKSPVGDPPGGGEGNVWLEP